MYQRWNCKNDSTFTVTYLNGEDITTFGATTGAPQTKTYVKINDKDAFDAAVSAMV